MKTRLEPVTARVLGVPVQAERMLVGSKDPEALAAQLSRPPDRRAR